jgi:membrane fusion protein (multidrug efflux system)
VSAAVIDDTLSGVTATPAKGRAKPSRRALIAVGVAVVVALAGVIYIASAKPTAGTDDAYVQADNTVVAPKVRGLIAEVYVRDNQAVVAGQPLLRLDAEEYDARVAAAAADLQAAQASVEAAQAALTSHAAEETLAASTVREVQTSIRATDAQSQKADADRGRYERLVAGGAVAQHDADQYRAAAVSADADAERSRAALEVSQNQAILTRSHRATLQAGLEQARAAEAKARAALDLAHQDQANSIIRAPIAGVVGARQAQPGDYVQPGTRLLTLVPNRNLYVTANFKETQTTRMVVGDPVEVRVDALPGVKLKGVVDSLSPGSGAEFALLPFEPGNGNFTKIVQRVPVRVRLDAGQEGLLSLRPGLSATVVVRLSPKG